MPEGFCDSRPSRGHRHCLLYGRYPQRMVCPFCQKVISTRLERSITTKTHIIALCMCITIPCVPCLPYCIDSCKAVDHYCPECGNYLGTYSP
ncbi:lipopolysaccharide-induced tumor necrosis factor-alpha factor homolog [Rhodnius prolixus]|uniref:Putative lipopolysaccharide-induced tumor necrosis factor-alpha factor-like protein n=1 Tax=Rhodnius prolixus TaxID=13249 RepID=A0A4P6DAA3_RHOPR